MKRMIRGLVIAWYYPPGNSSEGIVTYKLLKNSSCEYDVFTRLNPQENMWDRKIVEKEMKSNNVTIYERDARDKNKWISEAVQFFEENRDKYDFLMTRSMGVEPHEAGLIVKEKHPEVKWIASFGDPLVDSPYIETFSKQDNPFFAKEVIRKQRISKKKWPYILLSPTRNIRRMAWERERRIKMKDVERLAEINDSVFANADEIILNNDYQLEHAMARKDFKKYEDKCIALRHSYDETLYSGKSKKSDDKKIKFSYVGHLDDLRNARALLKGISHLKKNNPGISDRVEFSFYGHLSERDKAYIIDEDITDLVKVHKDISYLESLDVIKQSDWSILIDANLNDKLEKYIYLPAKTADYFGAKAKIFCITQRCGATYDAMKNVNAGVVVSHSADEIYLYLSKIILQGYSPAQYNEKERLKYDARSVAKEFDDMVKGLTKK